MEKIGARIRKLRIEQGISQTNFAKLLGYTQGAFSAIESSKYPLPYKRISQISDLLGISVSELLTGTDYESMLGYANTPVQQDQQDQKEPIIKRKTNVIQISDAANEMFAIFPFLPEADQMKVLYFAKKLYARSVIGE